MKAFVLSVFGGAGATGSPTGVVLLDEAPRTEAAQAFAARLGVPDTAFVWKDGGRWRARFFSPMEELSVCFQALLAVAHVVGELRSELLFGERVVAVERQDGRWWVRLGAGDVVERGSLETPFGVGRIIDSGRVRAFVRVEAARFEALEWLPSEALSWLRAHSLSGVCLVDAGVSGRVRLRVFTSSLGGNEDVATGGAVAGLPLVLGPGRHLVEQGRASTRRGLLLAQGNGETVSVGGEVLSLINGTLASALGVTPT